MSRTTLRHLHRRHALIFLFLSAYLALGPAHTHAVLEFKSNNLNNHPYESDTANATTNDNCSYANTQTNAGGGQDSVDSHNCAPEPFAARATNYCPAYPASPLFRQRANSLTIGPDEDWQSLIEGAAPNTEILLRDGVYQLSNYAVVLGNSNVTIRSASGNRNTVRIVGQGYGPGSEGFMVLAANITIADLSMRAIRNHAISIKPEVGAARTHIYNVHLFNIGTQHIKGSSGDASIGGVVACSSMGYTPGGARGDYLGAIDIHSAVNWIVRDNYIYNINGDGSGCEVDIDCGTYIYGAPSIFIWNGSRGSIVERNTIVDSYRGIALGLGSGHQGGVIRNNFIYRPIAGDAGIELWTANNLLVEHNTVILGGDYPGAIEYRESSNITVRNNLISAQPWDRGNNSGINLGGNIGNATAREFITPGDPHLRSNSRAIGAGIASNLATDIDGDSRSGRADVGADQYSEDPDEDGDGVDVDADQCPATPAGVTVNRFGCSIAQLVPCAGPQATTQSWQSHSQYFRRITRISKTFVIQGLITVGERIRVVRVASRARCGR